jgi:hypothetical protein
MKGAITQRLDEITKKTQSTELTKVAITTFRDNTPIRNGNARRNTKAKQDEIHANYAYAKRLDTGYSKQSPDGMSKPTIEAVRRYLKDDV